METYERLVLILISIGLICTSIGDIISHSSLNCEKWQRLNNVAYANVLDGPLPLEMCVGGKLDGFLRYATGDNK